VDDQDDLPDRLTAGPLTVRMERTPAGPMLVGDDPATEPLSFAVNATLGGVLEGLGDRLLAGESMSRAGVYVLHASEVDGPPPGAGNWRALTGTEAGPDSYVVGAEFLPETLLVPREVLVEILTQLARLRGA
jgi:hypothetical protein